MSRFQDPPGGRPHDDDISARLRRALTAEADMVNPSGDGLGRIQAGIERRRSRWWANPAVALAAAAAVGVTVAGVAVGLNRDGGNVVADAPSVSPQPVSTPTEPAPSTPSASSSAEPVTVPVYYLHDDGSGPRLYREFHAVAGAGGQAAVTALREMFAADPVDPDYSSSWPDGTRVLGYQRSGDTATVDLSKAATTAKVGAQAAEASLQQLVWTVTAADRSVRQVRLRVEGRPVAELWGHVPVGDRAFSRAPALDVQGLIWVLAPTQGRTVASPVEVTVFGTAFEGNVTLKVFRGDREVESGFVTTSMGEFKQAGTTFDLPAGSYTVRAYDENAEAGTLVERDSKDFTVR
jgi:spore germination protein GerM